MIELKDIVVKFGDFEALHNINVNVKEGEFFTFLGPSGCGKTTTLRTITGFIEPVSGTVSVGIAWRDRARVMSIALRWATVTSQASMFASVGRSG